MGSIFSVVSGAIVPVFGILLGTIISVSFSSVNYFSIKIILFNIFKPFSVLDIDQLHSETSTIVLQYTTLSVVSGIALFVQVIRLHEFIE